MIHCPEAVSWAGVDEFVETLAHVADERVVSDWLVDV
jgi:hypothetical protein